MKSAEAVDDVGRAVRIDAELKKFVGNEADSRQPDAIVAESQAVAALRSCLNKEKGWFKSAGGCEESEEKSGENSHRYLSELTELFSTLESFVLKSVKLEEARHITF